VFTSKLNVPEHWNTSGAAKALRSAESAEGYIASGFVLIFLRANIPEHCERSGMVTPAV
jgi:hypothetical protein